MRPIGSPDVAEGLVRQFALRGASQFPLDESIVPMQDTGDFAGSSPYLARRIVAGTELSPAVAATNSFVLITPGLNTLLVIESLAYFTAGNIVDFKIFRPVDVAAMTVTATNPTVQLCRPRIRPTGFLPQGVAVTSFGNHVNANLGAQFWQDQGASTEWRLFPFKRGIVLDGTDPAGASSIGVICLTQNNQCRVAFMCSEYYQQPEAP